MAPRGIRASVSRRTRTNRSNRPPAPRTVNVVSTGPMASADRWEGRRPFSDRAFVERGGLTRTQRQAESSLRRCRSACRFPIARSRTDRFSLITTNLDARIP